MRRTTFLVLVLFLTHLVCGFVSSRSTISSHPMTAALHPVRTGTTGTVAGGAGGGVFGVIPSALPPAATTTVAEQQQQQRRRRTRQQQQRGDERRSASFLLASVAPGGSGGGGAEVGKKKCPFTATMRILTSLWAVVGVVYILAKAIVRVTPIALEPFQNTSVVPLQPWQLALYIGTCLWFAYVEGYKGFQTKFSPLVVKRAFTLVPGQSHFLHILLAPLYSMALFHAQRKRLVVSWCVTLGVTAVVAAVKRLPYPYRNIIDAGVVAGLTWGSISILVLYGRAMVTGTLPSIDPALPTTSSSNAASSTGAAIQKKK